MSELQSEVAELKKKVEDLENDVSEKISQITLMKDKVREAEETLERERIGLRE